jgi:hypothetical protein
MEPPSIKDKNLSKNKLKNILSMDLRVLGALAALLLLSAIRTGCELIRAY